MISSLVTDAMLPWSSVLVLPECGSTNAELLRDPQPWRVVTTDHQVSGRGRLTRSWETPAFAAVALSAAVPLPPGREADLGWLPLLTGLAVRAAVRDHGLEGAVLKWPNDVLVTGDDEKKLCGILCEVAAPPAGERVVVIGLGINVDQTREELPVDRATSMALAGCGDVDRDRLVVSVLAHLADRYARWARGGVEHARLVAEYQQECVTVGREVEIHLPGEQVRRGRAVRVDADGRLVVDGPGGEVAHAAGDVVHARLSPPGGAASTDR